MKVKIKKLINEVLENLNITEPVIFTIEIPNNKANGDYASNVAFLLSKQLKKSPLEIAELVRNKIVDSEIIKIEVVKPGFLNFFVKKDYLLNNINCVIAEEDSYGSPNIGQGQRINLEFVSANPTGILHLGNARGGSYGDSMARIFKFVGYEVNKEYYVNDAGNQVNNLALSLQARYLNLMGKEVPMPEDGYFGDDIKKIARDIYEEIKDENLDLETFKKMGIEKLLDVIKKDLKAFNIEYDIFTSEKSLYDQGLVKKTLDILEKNNYIYESEGAKWLKASVLGSTRDVVLVKNDGQYTYLLPDIAHHVQTIEAGYNRLINVVGADHHGYVSSIKAGIKAMGYDENSLDVKLLQMVKLIKGGEELKMSKRSGNVVTVRELINAVGVNVARYFFTMRSLDTQMDFDLELALKKTNENPVYYISYAYARICSILSEHDSEKRIEKYETINQEAAYNVLEKVYEFKETVENAANKECPHIIANYAYELATLFHSYYSSNRIISSNEKENNENINMLKAIKITIKNSLNLIGINPPERM